MLCGKCKIENEESAKYCKNCGLNLHPFKRGLGLCSLGCGIPLATIAFLAILLLSAGIYFSMKGSSDSKKVDFNVVLEKNELEAYHLGKKKLIKIDLEIKNISSEKVPVIGFILGPGIENEKFKMVGNMETDPPYYTNRVGKYGKKICYPESVLDPGESKVYKIGMTAAGEGEIKGEIKIMTGIFSETNGKTLNLKVTKDEVSQMP